MSPPGHPVRIVHRELVYEAWLRIHRLQLAMPNGEVSERHLEDHGDAVAVLPYDPDRRMALLIRQPRGAVLWADEAPVLELIAGLDDGEPGEVAARREAVEEGGLALAALEPIGRIWSMVGVSTERMALYLARYGPADRVTAGGGAAEENEGIEVTEVPLAALKALVEAGELTDAKTLIAVQALMLRRPELFAAA